MKHLGFTTPLSSDVKYSFYKYKVTRNHNSFMFLRGRHSWGDNRVSEPAANQQAAHSGHHGYGWSFAADRLRGAQCHHLQFITRSKEVQWDTGGVTALSPDTGKLLLINTYFHSRLVMPSNTLFCATNCQNPEIFSFYSNVMSLRCFLFFFC